MHFFQTWMGKAVYFVDFRDVPNKIDVNYLSILNTTANLCVRGDKTQVIHISKVGICLVQKCPLLSYLPPFFFVKSSCCFQKEIVIVCLTMVLYFFLKRSRSTLEVAVRER